MAMTTIDAASGSLSNSYINSTVFQGIREQENQLKTTMNAMSGDSNVTSAQMLVMQQQMQQWAIMVDIQSTITKIMADSTKSVVQKSS